MGGLTDDAKKPFTDLATAAKEKYTKIKEEYDASPGAIAFKAKKAALKAKEKAAAAEKEAKRAENGSEEDNSMNEIDIPKKQNNSKISGKKKVTKRTTRN